MASSEDHDDPLRSRAAINSEASSKPDTSGDPSVGGERSTTSRQKGPRSAYYAGPPGKDSAFGTPPVGVIGRDKPREIVR